MLEGTAGEAVRTGAAVLEEDSCGGCYSRPNRSSCTGGGQLGRLLATGAAVLEGNSWGGC